MSSTSLPPTRSFWEGPEPADPDDSKGRQQFFRNGHVVVSPNQGSHMVTVAYRQGNRANSTWGCTNPFSFQVQGCDRSFGNTTTPHAGAIGLLCCAEPR